MKSHETSCKLFKDTETPSGEGIPFSLAILIPLGTLPSVAPLAVPISRTTPSLAMPSLVPLPLTVPALGPPSFLLGFGRPRSRPRSRSPPMVPVPNANVHLIITLEIMSESEMRLITSNTGVTYLSLLRTMLDSAAVTLL